MISTTESPKVPWGPREYFSREEFEADLKRIVAYYRDRGYPDARVKSFDVRLSDDQKSVRLKIDIEEGEPIRVERVVLNGLDPIPEDHRRNLEARLPLKAGAPLDRALVQASREAALDELKDHGYPSPDVNVCEVAGVDRPAANHHLHAQPGRLAYVGRIEIAGTSSVNERIVRRQLTFRRGQLFQQSKLRESQRRLYSMELFNFVNVEAVDAGRAPEPTGGNGEADQIADPGDGNRRQASQGQLRRRLRDRRESARRGRLAPRQLLRRRAHGRACSRATRRSIAAFASISGSPTSSARVYSFGMSAQSWFSDEPAYELTTIGGRATIAREFTRARSVLAPATDRPCLR